MHFESSLTVKEANHVGIKYSMRALLHDVISHYA